MWWVHEPMHVIKLHQTKRVGTHGNEYWQNWGNLRKISELYLATCTLLSAMSSYDFAKCYHRGKPYKGHKGSLYIIFYNCMGICNYLKIALENLPLQNFVDNILQNGF